MSLPEPTCVIPRGFQRYHVEVSVVRCSGNAHARWWKANPCIKPHYEAEVWRGVGRTSIGLIVREHGIQCCGPGWDDVFGRTPAEAVHKARKLAREWVRWQLSLSGRGD
jgi:hypothetical protein